MDSESSNKKIAYLNTNHEIDYELLMYYYS